MNAPFPALAARTSRGAKPRLGIAQLIVGLAALTMLVRVVGVDSRPLWLDEAYSAWFSARSWHELWAVVPTYEPHPPLFYSLLKLWRGLVGDGAAVLRGFSILCAVATVLVVVACVREQDRQRPSGLLRLRIGIAGMLAACSPMIVLLGQEARPYPLLILAYSVAILGLLRLLREFQGAGPGNWTSWLLLGAGTELALWSHGLGPLYAIALALALLPAWWTGPRPAKRVWRGLIVAAATALLYAPCLVLVLARAGDWGSGWLKWEPIQLLLLLNLYSVPIELLGVASTVAGVLMLLLLKRASEQAVGSPGWTADKAMFVVALIPALLAVLISFLFMPVFLIRALSATMIPAYLLMAGAVARTRSARDRKVVGGALCAALLVSGFQVALRPALEPWDEVAEFLDGHVQPGDQLWLYPNDSALPLAAAGWARATQTRAIPDPFPALASPGLVRAGSPAVKSLTPVQARAFALDGRLRSVPTIWLLSRQGDVIDPAGDLPAQLSRVRRPGAERRWGIISVRPYALTSFKGDTDARR